MPTVDKRSPLPRYVQARQYLEELIRHDGIGPGDQLPSERDLAAQFQVSQMTMNRAIQEMVRDGLLYREVGRGTFVVRQAGDSPVRGALGLVSLVHPGEIKADPYIGEILRGVQNAALVTGWDLNLIQEQVSYPTGLSQRLRNRADGFLIMSPPDEAIPTLQHLVEAGTPFLSVGSSWLDQDIPAVDSDNILGVDLAVEHLAALGHRSIGMIGAPENLSNARDRHTGFLASMEARGLTFRPEWYLPCQISWAMSMEERDRIAALMQRPDAPTALIAVGYVIAINTVEAIQSVGMNVPGDVSVVGFDDKFSAAFLNPPLTTVAQPLEEMGERAVRRLEGIVRGDAPDGIERLPTRLVVRDSTAPPVR